MKVNHVFCYVDFLCPQSPDITQSAPRGDDVTHSHHDVTTQRIAISWRNVSVKVKDKSKVKDGSSKATSWLPGIRGDAGEKLILDNGKNGCLSIISKHSNQGHTWP